MTAVEIGIKLNKDLKYYDNVLKQNGFINDFNCETHDIYYTNKNLDNLTENEMKKSCVRIRMVNEDKCSVQNTSVFLELNDVVFSENINEVEMVLKSKGFIKIFDTIKKDHHYGRYDIEGKIQLQEIKDIGLVVYYDNSKYYTLSEEEQWKKLIDELNLYGFDFKYEDYGIDKLRTLYYKKEMYSKNQNG